MPALLSCRPLLATLLLTATPCAPASARVVSGDEQVPWTVLDPQEATSSQGADLKLQSDKSILLFGAAPDKDTHVVKALCSLDNITGLRIEALPHPSLPKQGPGCAANGNFVLTKLSIKAGNKFTTGGNKVSIRYSSSSHAQNAYPISGALDDNVNSGWAILPRSGKPSEAVFELNKPLNYRGGSLITLEMKFEHGSKACLGHYSISATDHALPRAGVENDIMKWHDVQKKVGATIDKGCEYLITKQQLDGSWAGHVPAYPTGQTALSLYTLIKSGVRKDHPAVRRAAAFIRARMPIKTYSAACQILAYAALEEEVDEKRIEAIANLMVEWQHPNGGWGYPGGAGDLSNTQYAALALWTAAQHGAKIPQDVWLDLAKWTASCQREGKGPYAPAGFSYRPKGTPTSSMTAAGTAVMKICLDMSGRRAQVKGSMDKGIGWLSKHFSVTSNVKEEGRHDTGNTLYYLYGLERVGAFCELDTMGAWNWYREGARYLVASQTKEGGWHGNSQEKSCFALLFLSKATASLTGGVAGRGAISGTRTYGNDNPEFDVSLRAAGDNPLNVWISSWGTALVEDCSWEEDEGKGLRVVEVEYLYWNDEDEDPMTLEVRPGDPSQPNGTERYAAQHQFAHNGKWYVMAEVTIQLPDEEGEDGHLIVESEALELTIREIVDETLIGYAGDAQLNLLNKIDVVTTASSEYNNRWTAGMATDDFLARGWLCKNEDAHPKLTLQLQRPTRGNTVLLTPSVAGGNFKARATKLKITVNGKITGEVEMIPRDDRKTEWVIPKNTMIRRIEIEVVERSPGKPEAVGFAEVELQNRKKSRRP